MPSKYTHLILKNFLKKTENYFKNPILWILNYIKLREKNFTANFVYEGYLAIKLPKISFWKVFSWEGNIINKNSKFIDRPHAEVLLRKIVYEMYKNDYINSNESIIDIGSWIGDNSMVWATWLNDDAVVFAVDPSSKNLSYCKMVAEINNIKNIKLIEAVCAEIAGKKLDFDGSLDHAKFNEANSDKCLISKTLDQLILNEKETVIGLLHVDVEGFELQVLKGAQKIIIKDSPAILFEQHISQDDVNAIFKFLKGYNYRIFMINEVLPGCQLDCRNFLAIHSSKKIPILDGIKIDKNVLDFYKASEGPLLIEV